MALDDPLPAAERAHARPLTARQVRDIVGALLVLCGVGILVTVAWIVSPLAGLSVIGVACMTAGIILASDRW